jgi:hypothetical protein
MFCDYLKDTKPNLKKKLIITTSAYVTCQICFYFMNRKMVKMQFLNDNNSQL